MATRKSYIIEKDRSIRDSKGQKRLRWHIETTLEELINAAKEEFPNYEFKDLKIFSGDHETFMTIK